LPYLHCTKLSADTYEARIKDEHDFDKDFRKKWNFSLDIEGRFDIPEELLGQLGWKDNDLLEWFETRTEEFLLVKIVK
jgi:hypothetical protein|tara:strand:+ start:5189 stop:5422 length:234 start_codon:yes stop_codon:yes gene_type:complete